MTLDLVEKHISSGCVIAADFYIANVENGEALDWGYRLGRIENVDHHAPVPRMRRPVSSTNLALLRLASIGPAKLDEYVAINHTDCDSVLTASLLLGLLSPDERFGDAAIAADHSGEEDAVADLLQALDKAKDFAFSLGQLRRLNDGLVLDARAQTCLDDRRRMRDRARSDVPGFSWVDRIAFREFENEIDGELLPALLPQAIAIVVGYHSDDRWYIKVRLGPAWTECMPSLQEAGLMSFDSAYGGRWNAGSNKRGGGGDRRPEGYAEHLAQVYGSLT